VLYVLVFSARNVWADMFKINLALLGQLQFVFTLC
jgi:hypothetical protein